MKTASWALCEQSTFEKELYTLVVDGYWYVSKNLLLFLVLTIYVAYKLFKRRNKESKRSKISSFLMIR